MLTAAHVSMNRGATGDSDPSSDASVSPRLQAMYAKYIRRHWSGWKIQRRAGTAPVASTLVIRIPGQYDMAHFSVEKDVQKASKGFITFGDKWMSDLQCSPSMRGVAVAQFGIPLHAVNPMRNFCCKRAKHEEKQQYLHLTPSKLAKVLTSFTILHVERQIQSTMRQQPQRHPDCA